MLINKKVIFYMLNYKANNAFFLKTYGKLCNVRDFQTDYGILFTCTDCVWGPGKMITFYSLNYLWLLISYISSWNALNHFT